MATASTSSPTSYDRGNHYSRSWCRQGHFSGQSENSKPATLTRSGDRRRQILRAVPSVHQQGVRNAYAVAERKYLGGWINLFTADGVFTDNSVGVTYRGRTLADPIRSYGTAFSDMHRELYRIYADGNVVIVNRPNMPEPISSSPATAKQPPSIVFLDKLP